jgi:hypothetical protein
VRALADPSPALVEPYRRVTIVSAALAEAPGLFALVVYMVTRSGSALAVAAGCVLLLALQLPSRERLRRFADEILSSAG